MRSLNLATRTMSLLVPLLATIATAQERGFAVERYDGTSAGSATFLVARPWYSDQRLFAVGLTVDGALAPLVPRLATGRGGIVPILSSVLTGHVDLAGSLFNRVQVSASLPVSLLERGSTEFVSQVGPLPQPAPGDPRVGVMVRLLGEADREAVSIHLGGDAWLPIGAAVTHQGDTGVRAMGRLVLAGAFGGVGRWGTELGFLYRPAASIGPPQLGMTAASEARVGVALGVSLWGQRLHLGPEAQYAVQVAGDNALTRNGMSLEVLAGLHLLLAENLLLGVSGGAGFLGAAGTPDARGIVRLAWAPRRDFDSDGVANVLDLCPNVPSGPRGKDGCPAIDDADSDGVPDAIDRCPYEPETINGIRDEDGCPEYELAQGTALAHVLAPKANAPQPKPAGAPQKSVTPPSPTATKTSKASEPADAPVATTQVGRPGDQPASSTPSKATAPEATAAAPKGALPTGEPEALAAKESAIAPPVLAFSETDSDGDGVPDEFDRCPSVPEDQDGFEDEDGCPEPDNDHDGIPDVKDSCPFEAETVNGVDDEDGCPDLGPDADGDGIADAVDRCPFEPETINGVRDEDGCPEPDEQPMQVALASLLAPPVASMTGGATVVSSEVLQHTALEQRDSDHDGVLDEADRCPLEPEDKDGFEDEDGCPEPDNDGDGLVDSKDQCPFEAETVNGWKDDDGCPDEHPDIDGDGVPYALDRCPFEPGDASDGCPHVALPALSLPGFPGSSSSPDSPTASPTAKKALAMADFDHDGVPDEADPCPMSAEDKDGFEDEDGCPEPDNDRDGIPDAKDKCPLEAETINGVKDDDGCPDVGVGAVTVEHGEVVIDRVVGFKPASATLQPTAGPLLQQVAATLRAHSTLAVEIAGHTDDTGSAVENIRLSKKRAEAIRAFLIKAGVAANRLKAAGYGPTRPRATNKTAEGREKNRRVEFLILGEKR